MWEYGVMRVTLAWASVAYKSLISVLWKTTTQELVTSNYIVQNCGRIELQPLCIFIILNRIQVTAAGTAFESEIKLATAPQATAMIWLV